MDYCTLYLDASGDFGWPPPFGKSKNNWYVLAGIILTPEADLKAKNETLRILKKYISEDVRVSYTDSEYELHYTDIIFGNNIFSKLEEESLRKSIADEVFKLILELKPILVGIAINKLQMKRVYQNDADSPKFLAIRSVINKFSMYLKRRQKIGSIVYDAEEYRKDVELRNEMHGFRRHGIMRRGGGYQPMYEDKLENILNTINLSPSEMSPGLQLADFCARSIWQHHEHNKSDRYTEISSLWEYDERASRTYTETIFPSRSKWIV
ncbi:MAG TPA: DUF3800 domain-containing protein [Verrucomicrobiae bacterium]|nr:DUF3800 domain-containing protein [Verrucomicrobiae bacterium]